MSIMEYNGAAVIAMTGKKCVAIACDKRFGIQGQTIATNLNKIFEFGPHMYVALTGLISDMQTVRDKLRFRKNLYELRESRKMKPKVLESLVSNLLYEHRFGPFFVEPVIAGLDPVTFEPFVSKTDLIGCPEQPEDFVCRGTCEAELYGVCETFWRPNLEPDELFETISQSLCNAFDRDALSGWGAIVYVIEADKVTVREIKTRMD